MRIKKISRLTLLCAALLLAALSSGSGVQLLLNPAFDTAVPGQYVVNGATNYSSGWLLTGPLAHGVSLNAESIFSAYPTWGSMTFHTTPGDALRMRAEWGSVPIMCQGYAWQEISALPNSPYTASAWVFGYGTFGTSTAEYAELIIEEKDSAGTVINTINYTTDPTLRTTASGSWVHLQKAFTSKPTTNRIVFKLNSMLDHYYTTTPCHIVWDDASFDGVRRGYNFTVSGTVYNEGTALSGATVSVYDPRSGGWDTTTTNSSGTYTIAVKRDSLRQIKVMASKTGYLSQPKWLDATENQNHVVTLDLVAAHPSNLLQNPDFEPEVSIFTGVAQTGTSSGWNFRAYPAASAYGKYVIMGAEVNLGLGWPQWGPTSVRSGNDAVRFRSFGLNGRITLSQTIPVNASTLYNSGVWVFGCSTTGKGFGVSLNDYAMLQVEEFTSANTLITSHNVSTVQPNVWVKLTQNFTTASNAAYVIYSIDTKLNETYILNDPAHVTIDSAYFDGPAPAVTFTGKVTSGGSNVQGATVVIGSQSATTDSLGSYTISVPGMLQVNIRASKTGYLAQQKSVTGSVSGTTTVNFSLDSVGNNLLTNAGFDDGGLTGWSVWSSPINNAGYSYLHVEAESATTGIGATAYYDVGSEACHMWTCGNGDSKVYQMISVNPSQSYQVSCRFRPGYDPAKLNDPVNPINWGLAESSQWARLFVEEYAVDGTLISARYAPAVVNSGNIGSWQTLSLPITMSSRTKWVKIGGWANIIDYYPLDLGRAIFDTFVFGGSLGTGGTPPDMPSVYGVVRDLITGNPISGARVEIMNSGLATTTDANGAYNLNPPLGYETEVRVSKSAYYAQRKSRFPSQMINFDIDPVGNNILVNAGFDDGFPGGVWNMSCLDISGVEGGAEARRYDFGPYFSHTGEGAAYMASMGIYPPRTGEVSQFVSVKPSTAYTAKCRFRAARNKSRPPASIWEFGIQQGWRDGWLKVYQYDANGQELMVDPPVEVAATKVNDWETITASFITEPNAVVAKIAGYAVLGTDEELNGSAFINASKTVFDSFELRGPQGPGGDSIADISGMSDGSPVMLLNKPVAVGLASQGICYIEEWNRTIGIRVESYAMRGSTMTVFGTVQTVNGERAIVPTYVAVFPYGWLQGFPLTPAVAPLGLNNRGLGASLSPVGLCVTVWGKIDSVDSEGSVLTLTDGAGTSVKVYYADCTFPNDYVPAVNDYIAISGAVGAELQGVDTVRVIRAFSGAKKN